MAPEQARGDVSNIDKRTDVFGLGGILCRDSAVWIGRSPARWNVDRGAVLPLDDRDVLRQNGGRAKHGEKTELDAKPMAMHEGRAAS